MPKSRPLIGITTQTLQAIDGIPEGLPQSVVMNQRYYHAAAMAGAAPVLIPLLDDTETLRAIYERMDGILIPGGVDIDPAAFGETPHERLGRIDPARDRVEIQLAKWAVEDEKPALPKGAKAPLKSGGAPKGYPVKGNADSGLYHEPDGQWYDQTEAEFYFKSAEDAEAAGFTRAGGGSADAEAEEDEK